MVAVHFLPQHNYHGGTGKFIYKESIFDNKQLFSNMIDCEATQVLYFTRIAFLKDSYIFAILTALVNAVRVGIANALGFIFFL